MPSFLTRAADVQYGSQSADHRPLDREAACSTPAGGAQPHTRMGGKKSKPTHETEQKRIPQGMAGGRTEETVNAISCCSQTATGDEHFRCVWGRNNMDQAPNRLLPRLVRSYW